MNITIRPATAEDAGEVVRLGQEFDSYLTSLGDDNPTSFTEETYLRDGFGDDPPSPASSPNPTVRSSAICSIIPGTMSTAAAGFSTLSTFLSARALA